MNKMKKSLRYGAASTLFVVIVLVGFILLNVITGVLADRINFNLDLTPNSIYKVSEDTYQLLDSISSPVDVYIFKSESSLDSVALTYLKQYDQYSDKLSLHTADLNVNPTFANQYGVTSADQILFVSQMRSKIVNVKDIYYSNSYTNAKGVCADYRFASAVKFVTAEKIPTMAVLTGHNELTDTATKYSTFFSLAKDSCYLVKTVDLRYDEIPDDATYVAIVGASLDFTIEEIDKLDKFLSRKAEDAYTLLVALDYTASEMPNLSGYLQEWGITPHSEMVFETTSFLRGSSYVLSAQTGDSDLTSTFKGTLAMPTSLWLELDYKINHIENTILQSTSKAYARDVKLINLEEEDSAENVSLKTYPLAVMSSYAESAGTRVVDYHVIVFGSANALSNEYVGVASYRNDELLTACFETAITDETSIYVSPRYYVDSTLALKDEAEKNAYIVLIGLIALGLMAGAVVVYIRRKNK